MYKSIEDVLDKIGRNEAKLIKAAKEAAANSGDKGVRGQICKSVLQNNPDKIDGWYSAAQYLLQVA